MSDKKIVEELTKEKEALTGVVEDLRGSIAGYEELGTPEQISEVFDKVTDIKETLDSYQEIGSIEMINEAIDRAYGLLNEYKELGSPEQLNEAMDESIRVITEYKELGTPEELTKVLDKYEEGVVSSECDRLATKHNTTVAIVKKMYETIKDFKVVAELLEETFAVSEPKKEETKIEEGLETPKSASTVLTRICKGIM